MAAKVLLITGCGLEGPDIESASNYLFSSDVSTVWDRFEIVECNYGWGHDRDKVEKIVNELRSGKYRAAIVWNLSLPIQRYLPRFEKLLGPSLKAFVYKGGYIAFPTVELGTIVDTINRLFESTWRQSSYISTTCGPLSEMAQSPQHLELATFFFPGMLDLQHTAKTVHLRGVPCHERVFFAPSRVNLSETDTKVAVHVYGPARGGVAVLGDVNLETNTILLLNAFILSRFLNPKEKPETVVSFGGTVINCTMSFNRTLEEQLVPPRDLSACTSCTAPGAAKMCSRCCEERYCDVNCQRDAWLFHRLVCGLSIDQLRVNWKHMPIQDRHLFREHEHSSEELVYFLEEMKMRAEEAFEAVLDGNMDDLTQSLQLLDIDTTSDDAGLSAGIGLTSRLTLFHYAIQQDQKVAMAERLLSMGANVNCVDDKGESAFISLYLIFRRKIKSRSIDLPATVRLLRKYDYKLHPGEDWSLFDGVCGHIKRK